MRTVKLLLKILVALVLLLVLAAVALVFLFDPNMFRPHLESAARDHGIELRIEGNLGWQLWPALGVEVNGIHVAALEAPDEPIAQLENASLGLAIRPLLSGNLQVHHVMVRGAVLDLRVDENGRGNWEALLPDESEPAEQPETEQEAKSEEGEGLKLAVESISLRNAALRYQDESSGQTFELSPLNLNINGFNLQGEPFDLDLSWRSLIEDQELFGAHPMHLDGTLRSRFLLSEDMNEFRLSDGRLTVDLQRAGASGQIGLTLALSAVNLSDKPAYEGQLALASFNPRALMAVLDLPELEMASSEALTHVSLSAQFAGDTEQVALDPLRIELDQTRIEGQIAVTDIERAALVVDLNIDRINVDNYLPPPSEEEAEAVESQATGDEELIPLDMIRDLYADVQLKLQALQIMGMHFTDLSVQLSADQGLVQLKSQLQAYEGSVNVAGELDGRGDTAEIKFDSAISEFQLAPFLHDMELDENLQLSGALSAAASGTTRGVTMNQLMDALLAQAEFSGAQVRMAPLNIEEQFCRLMSLVGSQEAPEGDWPQYTEMRALSGRATMAEQVLRIESFEAGVSELTLGVVGQLNLKTEQYDFTLPMSLGSESTSAQGCEVPSNYWVNRSLSLLRCRGSLVEVNPLRDCGFDSEGVQKLVTEYAKSQLQERYGEQLEQERTRVEERLEEEKRELEDRARQRLRGDDDKSVEDRLRGLFGR